MWGYIVSLQISVLFLLEWPTTILIIDRPSKFFKFKVYRLFRYFDVIDCFYYFFLNIYIWEIPKIHKLINGKKSCWPVLFNWCIFYVDEFTVEIKLITQTPFKCGKAMLRQEWVSSTVVIRSHRKPTWNSTCVVFLCMYEISGGPITTLPKRQFRNNP